MMFTNRDHEARSSGSLPSNKQKQQKGHKIMPIHIKVEFNSNDAVQPIAVRHF